MRNLVYIIMDSARYDTYNSARTPNARRLGILEKRYSYASWTSPSHYVYLMGISPHKNKPMVFASEIYKEDFKNWAYRLGIPNLEFKSFVPELSLPNRLRKLGYMTIGKVSLPVLNEHTTFSTFFDEYKLMSKHNDFEKMVEEITFDSNQPRFYFLNLGETHYPYMLEHLPRIHGVHGVLKHFDDSSVSAERDETQKFFDMEQLNRFKNRQIECIEYIDRLLDKLFNKCPPDTHIILTSDHGELFGEDGYFGHGPVFHEKVFEVPFIEGKI